MRAETMDVQTQRNIAIEPPRTAQLVGPVCTLQGIEPMRYQWFKDGQRLGVATADSPHLILPAVNLQSSGRYHCQVKLFSCCTPLM